jgi:hypothetical protein
MGPFRACVAIVPVRFGAGGLEALARNNGLS